MIEVKHLYKAFGDKEVLKDINAVFEDGKTNLIIGQWKDRFNQKPCRFA